MTQPEQDEQKGHAHRFREAIGRKAQRKARARRREGDPLWRGLGMMGMVGWSVVIPTLLGTLLGMWLDRAWASSPVPWTLVLLLAGLGIGVVIAWRWVDEERREIGRDRRQDHE